MDKVHYTQVVSLDWLAFSVTLVKSDTERHLGAKLRTPKGYTLVTCQHGTPQYKRRYYLQTEDAGDKVATLLLEPHSSIINPDDMYVEVANPLLYTGGYLHILGLLAQVHEYSFHSLSRLDVACDFQPIPHQEAIIHGLQSMEFYAQGKREGCQFHDFHIPAAGGAIRKVARQMSWGGKQSAVKWKLYNKSMEVFTTDTHGHRWCSKPYIVATWASAGMGDTNVWRLEVSLTGASSFEWRGDKMGWPLIESGDWVAWYWDMVATRFVIRRNEGHVCRKNDTVVDLLDIPDHPHYRLREREGDAEQQHVDHAATLRACIAQLERPEVAFSAQWRDLWLTTTYEVLNRANLHGYFYRTMGMPFEEWAATIGDDLVGTRG